MPIHCLNRQILNITMKPTPEFRRKMRLRSEELRRNDEIEWRYVRSFLNECAPPEILGLPFDDRAWELWHRSRADLPIGWATDWLPVCIAHARRYRVRPGEDHVGAVSLGRLELVARRELGVVNTTDLASFRAELYRIADLAVGILGVGQ